MRPLDGLFVSIRAPARGRRAANDRLDDRHRFRSAPPRGGDARQRALTLAFAVSIRAPARGRLRHSRASSGFPSFDPRPREGATIAECLTASSRLFRSAPPRGGDRAEATAGRRHDVSIRAPARGRPFKAAPRPGSEDVSIRAPARGRPGRGCGAAGPGWFRSAPPRGGDRKTPSH